MDNLPAAAEFQGTAKKEKITKFNSKTPGLPTYLGQAA